MIELNRAPEANQAEWGEDDGMTVAQARKIRLNPAFVSVVMASERDADVTIVRMADGRGFRIAGTYAEVSAQLGYVDEARGDLN